MLFRCEHITQANPHHCLAMQFCLREISASRSIDSLHDLAVDFVTAINEAGGPLCRADCARRGHRVSNESKTNHTHADGRGELEVVISVDPACEQVCHAHLFT